MGHGPARELGGDTGPLKDLNPELAKRLTAALDRMDTVDAEFKKSRDDERLAQLVKAWNKICREIDGYLRDMAKVLIASHQISLDIGSDGGGIATKPFMEDMRLKFPKLQFKLNEDGIVEAVAGDMKYGRIPVNDIDYEWVEKMCCEWVIASAERVK